MSTAASELVSIARADLDALKTELKRLRWQAGEALASAACEPMLVQAMTSPRSSARIIACARSKPRTA